MPSDAAGVSLARRRVVGLLRSDGWADELIDQAALMTTELATNAVEHARTPYTLTVDLTDQKVRVDVRDASTSPPVVNATPSATALCGRGLVLVAALADKWGYEPLAGGKSVWFEAARDQHAVPSPSGSSPGR
jgi:anti-sigma regulatory factor (Ser/Thr protein kinase)